MSRLNADWLSAYLEYTEGTEAPDIFHYWTGVSTIAGALQRKVWLDMKRFIWTPNFYIVFVAPPGIISKSSTANLGMRLLRNIPTINFGPDALTWQAMISNMQTYCTEVPVSDDGSMLPMSCMTIASSELGTLLNPHDREMVDVLTDLWDGRSSAWKKATKTSGSEEILNPWINIISCTTPAWLSGNIPRHMIEAGLFSRIIFIWGDRKRNLTAYPHLAVPAGYEERERKLVTDLEKIAMMRGEYQIAKDAIEWGQHWYEGLYTRLAQGDPHLHRLGGYVARKQTHMHKLAMVIAASRRDQMLITLDDLQHADEVLNLVEKGMERVYSMASDDKSIAQMTAIVDAMRVYKELPRNQLFRLRSISNQMSHEDFEKALASAIHAGRVSIKDDAGTIKLYYNGEGE